MQSEYSVIGFYIILMIILNIISIGYGESIINNADFVQEFEDADPSIEGGNYSIASDVNSEDIFSILGFMLFADVPETSRYANAIGIYRAIYWVLVIPYTVLIIFIIARMLIPWGM